MILGYLALLCIFRRAPRTPEALAGLAAFTAAAYLATAGLPEPRVDPRWPPAVSAYMRTWEKPWLATLEYLGAPETIDSGVWPPPRDREAHGLLRRAALAAEEALPNGYRCYLYGCETMKACLAAAGAAAPEAVQLRLAVAHARGTTQ